MKEKRNEGGFTLIELLIVIIILAILAAIVVFAVGTTGSNAKTAACDSDAKTFETALESYKAEVGVYPIGPLGSENQNVTTIFGGTTLYGLTGNTANTTGDYTWSPAAGTTFGQFMRQLPSTTNYLIVTDGNGGVFVFPGGTTVPPVVGAALDGTTYTTNNFDSNQAICAKP